MRTCERKGLRSGNVQSILIRLLSRMVGDKSKKGKNSRKQVIDVDDNQSDSQKAQVQGCIKWLEGENIKSVVKNINSVGEKTSLWESISSLPGSPWLRILSL